MKWVSVWPLPLAPGDPLPFWCPPELESENTASPPLAESPLVILGVVECGGRIPPSYVLEMSQPPQRLGIALLLLAPQSFSWGLVAGSVTWGDSPPSTAQL